MAEPAGEEGTEKEPLIKKIRGKIEHNEKFFSLEFFPPKTFNGATNLTAIIGRITQHSDPLFCDFTWKASADPLSDSCKEPSTLLVSAVAIDLHGQTVMMHVPSTNVTKSQVFDHLVRAKALGVRSILAVREGPDIEEDQDGLGSAGFQSTVDLITFIRNEFGNHFTIAVAGYPSGFSSVTSYKEELQHVKAKIEAGADLIITQMFFDVETFFRFVEDCRGLSIDAPIIPGILPIQSYSDLRQLQRSSKIQVPQHITDTINPIKDDDEAIQSYGITYATDMCRKLFDSGKVHGIHIYTLNREAASSGLLKELNFYKEGDEEEESIRRLPWGLGRGHNKSGRSEDVRPIFWASRPQSYLIRTSNWEEFPNGRWGNSGAASFGQLKDYHLILFANHRSREELLNMWGRELNGPEDVFEIFECYLTRNKNRHGYKVTQLPWNEEEIAPETMQFIDQLARLNKHGILTINSQPHVNGLPSTDPVVGWGSPGGYVFQKAYLEFFTSEEIAMELYEVLKGYPHVNYHIVNFSGKEDVTNADVLSPNAVTWGVFPKSEILQPTVVDPIAFQFWKDEAFTLWKHEWGKIYPEGSQSRKVIESIHDTYYLINLVDNDYIAGNCLFDILDAVLVRLGKQSASSHPSIQESAETEVKSPDPTTPMSE